MYIPVISMYGLARIRVGSYIFSLRSDGKQGGY